MKLKSQRFKKTVHALVMMPGKNPLDLTDFDRKMINVVLKDTIAQAEPKFEVEGLVGRFFGMPTAEIGRLMGLSQMFGYEHLRDSLERLQKLTFKIESPSSSDNEMPDAPAPRLRASCVLLPTVVHEYRKDRDSTGSLMTWWKFNEELVPYLLEPKRYAILRMESITAMEKGPSIALYEICARFATSPSHSTGFKPTDWWVRALTGQLVSGPKRSVTYSEFKYFSRDVLVPAIKEINEKTELYVEIEQKKVGKKVTEIRFLVRPSTREENGEAPHKAVEGDTSQEALRVRALSLKITDRFFSQLCKTHPADVVHLMIESMEKTFARRAGNPNAEPIRSSNAYAKSVLNNILDEKNSGQKSLVEEDAAEPTPSTPRPRPARLDPIEDEAAAAAKSAEKLARFESLPLEQQAELIDRALNQMEGQVAAKPEYGIMLAKPIRDLKNRNLVALAQAAVFDQLDKLETAQA